MPDSPFFLSAMNLSRQPLQKPQRDLLCISVSKFFGFDPDLLNPGNRCG